MTAMAKIHSAVESVEEELVVFQLPAQLMAGRNVINVLKPPSVQDFRLLAG
jgi:hypothetical protein